MSYGRNPHYIYSDGDEMNFSLYGAIPENVLNAFLYKILLTGRREELKQRLVQGKEEWCYKEKYNNGKFESIPVKKEEMEWMNSQEDDILKTLLGEK